MYEYRYISLAISKLYVRDHFSKYSIVRHVEFLVISKVKHVQKNTRIYEYVRIYGSQFQNYPYVRNHFSKYYI